MLGKDAPEPDMHWNVVQNNGEYLFSFFFFFLLGLLLKSYFVYLYLVMNRSYTSFARTFLVNSLWSMELEVYICFICSYPSLFPTGARAAQLVPHVHFHVIPRPNTDVVPTGTKMSWVMFGRGQRDDLDDEEGEQLARAMREELAREVIRIKESEGIDLDIDSEPEQKGRSQVKL